MTPSERKALLAHVSSGLDVEAGAAQLGLSMGAVKKAGAKLARQLDEAYATGSARLRGRLLKAALSENDLKVIQGLLEQRALSASSGNQITAIERIIVDVPQPCAVCGHKPKPYPGDGISAAKLSDRRGGVEPQADSAGKS